MNSSKLKSFTIVKLLKILFFFRASFILGALLAILGVVLRLPMPLLTKYFIDDVIPKSNFHMLHIMGIILAGVLLLSIAIEIMHSYVTQILAEKISMHVGTISFGHLQDSLLRIIHNRSTGYWLNRIQVDPKKIGESFNKLINILTQFLTFLFGIVFIFMFSMKLGFFISLLLPFYAWSFSFFGKKMKFYSNKLRESNALLSGFIEETINGIEVIKALVIKEIKIKEMRKHWQKVIEAKKKSIIISKIAFIFSGGLSSLAPVIAFWYGGYLVMTGDMTLGELIAVNRFLVYIFGPIRVLTDINSDLQDTFAVLDRFDQIKTIRKELTNEKALIHTSHLVHGSFRGNNISFYYQGRKEQIFNELDFTLPLGKFIAIVGKSGSGKSTLLKLLVRFYRPDEGQIVVKSEDINAFDINSYRKSVCIVPQIVTLFSGTLRYNILLNRNVTPDDFQQIIKTCQLQELIDTLEDGLDCEIGPKGMQLSGGQRQKIALARALVTAPEVLLMDEFTSEIDVESESFIIQGLRELRQGKTTIVIAHRLTSVKDVDEIIVFSAGKIVERGKHDYLMETNGHYFSMFSKII